MLRFWSRIEEEDHDYLFGKHEIWSWTGEEVGVVCGREECCVVDRFAKMDKVGGKRRLRVTEAGDRERREHRAWNRAAKRVGEGGSRPGPLVRLLASMSAASRYLARVG